MEAPENSRFWSQGIGLWRPILASQTVRSPQTVPDEPLGGGQRRPYPHSLSRVGTMAGWFKVAPTMLRGAWRSRLMACRREMAPLRSAFALASPSPGQAAKVEWGLLNFG